MGRKSAPNGVWAMWTSYVHMTSLKKIPWKLSILSGFTYRSQKVIERFSFFQIFNCDRAEVVSKPDGWGDFVAMTKLHIILKWKKKHKM